MGTHPIFESDFDCLTEIMSASEEEYEVDRIINDRVEKSEKQCLIRWKNFGADDDTWEPVSNLDCPEIISLYEQNEKNSAAAKAESKKESAKRGATDESGALMFLMKWEGSELSELVPAKEANVKCPQTVIQFYEERLPWHSS